MKGEVLPGSPDSSKPNKDHKMSIEEFEVQSLNVAGFLLPRRLSDICDEQERLRLLASLYEDIRYIFQDYWVVPNETIN